jgi:hypothetical protein
MLFKLVELNPQYECFRNTDLACYFEARACRRQIAHSATNNAGRMKGMIWAKVDGG